MVTVSSPISNWWVSVLPWEKFSQKFWVIPLCLIVTYPPCQPFPEASLHVRVYSPGVKQHSTSAEVAWFTWGEALEHVPKVHEFWFPQHFEECDTIKHALVPAKYKKYITKLQCLLMLHQNYTISFYISNHRYEATFMCHNEVQSLHHFQIHIQYIEIQLRTPSLLQTSLQFYLPSSLPIIPLW